MSSWSQVGHSRYRVPSLCALCKSEAAAVAGCGEPQGCSAVVEAVSARHQAHGGGHMAGLCHAGKHMAQPGDGGKHCTCDRVGLVGREQLSASGQ